MNFKKIIPHLVAIAVFLIVACVYFAPSFSDYDLRQGDVQQYNGMSKEIVDGTLNNEKQSLWTNSMFSGMPVYQIYMAQPHNYLINVDQILKLGLPQPVGMLFMAMVGFYILMLCLRINPWLGILGGIAFGLSTINILYIGAGHITKVNAIAYMAPTLGGLILAFRGKLLIGGAIFALFFALNLSSNHLQMTYYLAFLLAFVAIGETVRLIIQKKFIDVSKIAGILILGSMLAILTNASNLMMTSEYANYSTRGTTELSLKPKGEKAAVKATSGLDTDYILEYNYGKRELLSLISPSAKGEKGGYIGSDEAAMENVEPQYAEQVGQMSHYWGGQRMSGGAFYFGVIMLVFFLFGLIFLKDHLKWPVLALTLLVLLLASNDPSGINDFFIHKFPMYNKFRDSKMILVLLQVMMPAIGVLFLDKLLKKEGLYGNAKTWLITSGVISFVVILLYMVPSISGDFITKDEVKMFGDAAAGSQDPAQISFVNGIKNSLYETRIDIYKKDFGRSVLLVLVACGLILIAAYAKLSTLIWSFIAIVFVTGDNMSVAKRYLNNDGLDETNTSWFDASTGNVPYLPDSADDGILENEKQNIPSFESKVSKMVAAMSETPNYLNWNSGILRTNAEFVVLNKNTDYRVLNMNNPFNETKTSYFHKSIGGYHGAKLKSYQELISFQMNEEITRVYDDISKEKNRKLSEYAPTYSITKENAQAVFDTISVGQLNLTNAPVLNMLNTRYIVVDKNSKPVLNASANGESWLVESIKEVKTRNQEMESLKDFDSKKTAIVNIEFKNQVTKNDYIKDSTDFIQLKSYSPDELIYEASVKNSIPAVFSEIYYPKGWNCYIDGKQVDYFRANYVLRAAIIPAGKHVVKWKFEPETYTTASYYSLLGSVLLLGLSLFIFINSIFFKENKTDEI